MRLARIYVHPIKSARGISLRRAELDRLGLRHDRRWMLVDENGTFLSQRALPRMALTSPSFSNDTLRVSAPEMPDLSLPLHSPETGERLPVNIFGDELLAAPAGEEADRWFASFLGVDCRLVYMPEDAVRPVDPRYAASTDRVGFADGFPLLMFSESSLADLNSRLPEPVSERRFRPNLLISGCGPFAEDGWKRLRIADVSLRVAKPCARCTIPTVDPSAGVKGKEPLRTLNEYRKVGSEVMFGQNLAHDGAGELRVGDAVKVLA